MSILGPGRVTGQPEVKLHSNSASTTVCSIGCEVGLSETE